MHPEDARKINSHERLVTWTLPQRPDWMSEEEYAKQPKTVEIRLVDVKVTRKGFRTKGFTVATTLLDRIAYRADWIAALYQG